MRNRAGGLLWCASEAAGCYELNLVVALNVDSSDENKQGAPDTE